MAAELCLASIALGPPLLGFAKSVVGVVNDFINAQRFIENKRTLHRLQREIDSWKSVMVAMNESQISVDRGSEELFAACQASLLRYRSNIRQIRRQVEKYNSSRSSQYRLVVVRNVIALLEQLKSEELDVKIDKWLTAVGTYSSLDTNNRVRQLQESVQIYQESVNRMEREILKAKKTESVLPTIGNHLWTMKEALAGLTQDCDQPPQVQRISDNSSSDDGWSSDIPGMDTVSTTLNDTLSVESKDEPKLRPPGYVDSSCQTIKIKILSTWLNSYIKAARSGKVHVKRTTESEVKREKEAEEEDPNLPPNQFAENIDTTESGYALVAGSFQKSETSSAPVLRIREEDWDDGRCFCFDTTDPQPVIRLHISLPPSSSEANSSRLKELPPTECDEAPFRTFSIVPLPVKEAKNRFRQNPSMLFTMSSSELKATKLALHWDLMGVTSGNDIYQRLGKLKDHLQQIGQDQEPTDPGLGSSTAAVVYVSIPWLKYEQWTQRKSKDDSLNVLAAEGILAILPALIQMRRGGSPDHRVWCKSKIRHSALYEDESEKSVHAIVQEYSYTGHPFQESRPSEVRHLIRFVVVIFRTGGVEEWVDLASSIYTPNLALSNDIASD